ncbi:MAG: hypothetical protein JNK74_16075 [Candidatus Hydrogenedentes bacterium]|nr:hypothetical protein [Candidatus Hydrogenedentota bacterium]
MSQDKELTRFAIALRIAGAAAIVVVAGLLGLVAGRLSAPDLLPTPLPEEGGEKTAEGAAPGAPVPGEPPAPLETPPIFLQLGIGPDALWDVIEAEAAYASGIGLHRFMIPAVLPWNDGEATTATLDAMKRLLAIDSEAEFLLQVDFNPPAPWFDTHGDDRMAGTVGDVPLPSPASTPWLEASRAAFDRLRQALIQAELESSVSGYALQGLLNGGWQRGPSADTSPANLAGFRAWLARTYADDAALQKAWKNPEATRAAAEIPVEPEGAESPEIFHALDTEQHFVDYHRYAAESVADAIGALAAHIRGTAGAVPEIWANYGHTFEKAGSSDGHLALIALLDSDVDGFVSPVSMLNRGIGATGGYMGPVDSARAHGKTWVIVDDTRTGIAWNKETGQIEQIRGLRAEDVHDVQRRNFALAAMHGLTLVWSDPGGEGFFHDDEQWKVFGQLFDVYQKNILAGSATEVVEAPAPAGEEETATEEGAPEESAPVEPVDGEVVPLPVPGGEVVHPTIVALVDEESQFLTKDATGIDGMVMANRDAILQSGASAEFYLLDDLLDERISPAPVYIFLNAYHLSSAEVKKLHERFAAERATAIWIYAPGYLDVTMNRTNVRDTVGMEVKVFGEPTPTGSKYALGGGHWIDAQQPIGEARLLKPLFYIDDPEADVLANFQKDDKPSVAVRTMEAGWTSVFIAEPVVSSGLLRELLRILEQPLFFRPGKQRFFDTSVINDGLIAIHAEQSGERIVNLGRFYDVKDLFDPEIGWPQRESFVLEMSKGETRLLQLSPL